jgi:GST-like protein
MPVFESGAIMLYLAGDVGCFLPADIRGRFVALQWLMFQMRGRRCSARSSSWLTDASRS